MDVNTQGAIREVQTAMVLELLKLLDCDCSCEAKMMTHPISKQITHENETNDQECVYQATKCLTTTIPATKYITLTFSEPLPQEYGEKLKLKSQNSGHSHSASKQIKLYLYNTLESSLKYSRAATTNR